MKKSLFILSMLLVVGLVSTFVYAETLEPATQQTPKVNVKDREAWFKERMEWKKEQINEAVKEGLITKEEAKTWNDHFAYMEKFHKENGFMPGCGGLGKRMMRGNRWNR